MAESVPEIFDVVDEQDVVVGVRPRHEVHRLKLRHRAVHIFLFRSGGEMLIHLRAADKEEFPGVWTSSASGHVSSGEDYAESAQRELFEELGVDAPLRRIGKVAACAATSHEFTELFLARSDAAVNPDPQEIADTRWLNPVEIRQQLSESPEQFSPAFRLLFHEFFDSLPVH